MCVFCARFCLTTYFVESGDLFDALLFFVSSVIRLIKLILTERTCNTIDFRKAWTWTTQLCGKNLVINFSDFKRVFFCKLTGCNHDRFVEIRI